MHVAFGRVHRKTSPAVSILFSLRILKVFNVIDNCLSTSDECFLVVGAEGYGCEPVVITLCEDINQFLTGVFRNLRLSADLACCVNVTL